MDGVFIKQYNSIKEAVLENGFSITSGSSNINCCCRGKTKSAYGYIWMYAYEYNSEFID